MIWAKGTHQSAKFQTFDCSREISPNSYFDGFLLLKVYKISANKVLRIYVSWHRRVMQNSICCFKNDKNLVNFDLSTRNSQISTLTGSFCAKYITFELKKYRGVIFHDTEE